MVFLLYDTCCKYQHHYDATPLVVGDDVTPFAANGMSTPIQECYRAMSDIT